MLDLSNYKQKAHKAVRDFWSSREASKERQLASGKADQGERSGVTSGKNMNGFLSLIVDIIRSNGLSHAEIHMNRAMLTLPEYFRPTKLWDILVIHRGELIVGWLMMVEDSPKSRKAVRDTSPHFPVLPEFQSASYLSRYDLLCQKLVKEGLYSSACLLASPREAAITGEFSEISHMTSLKAFITSLAGHIASESCRLG
jgi:type II restriction enzyme